MYGVKLGRGNDFSQFLHVHRFDVHDICQNSHITFPAFAQKTNGEDVLKLSLDIPRFQRLTLKSSAEM